MTCRPNRSTRAPKVDSAVVRMIPVKHRIGKADDFEHFAKLVKLAFHQRRKTIRNNLKELAGDEDLQAVGISPARPCRTYRAGEICGTEQLSRP